MLWSFYGALRQANHHNIRRFFAEIGKSIECCDGLRAEDGLGKPVLLEVTCPVVRVSA